MGQGIELGLRNATLCLVFCSHHFRQSQRTLTRQTITSLSVFTGTMRKNVSTEQEAPAKSSVAGQNSPLLLGGGVLYSCLFGWKGSHGLRRLNNSCEEVRELRTLASPGDLGRDREKRLKEYNTEHMVWGKMPTNFTVVPVEDTPISNSDYDGEIMKEEDKDEPYTAVGSNSGESFLWKTNPAWTCANRRG